MGREGTRELIADGQPWEPWSPRERVRPVFAVEPGRSGPSLMIAGAGNPYGFGWWARRVPVEAGRTYRFRARLRWEGLDDPNLHLLTAVAWRRADLSRSRCPQDYLATYGRDGDRVVVEEVLRAPDGTSDAELLLALRYAPGGTVWWESLTIEEVPAPRPRPLTVAVIRGRPPEPATAESARAYWAAQLEQAAASRPDLVCLPECLNQAGTGLPAQAVAEPLDGPMFQLLAEHAVRLGAYVGGCYYEDDDGYVFNTAVLLDRGGRRVGHYRKIHPYWPEEPDGVAPGDDLPVFPTEFGAVGIMICYDSWFGETARVLALKGAELVLFPNAGYETKIMPARAIDNRLYIAIASLNSPAAILNSLGEALVERRTPGVVAATIDLAQRPSPHPNAGGALNAGPGGLRATRNAASDRLLQELVEVHRWWSPPAPALVPAALPTVVSR
jgi:predicted amidohydrolase